MDEEKERMRRIMRERGYRGGEEEMEKKDKSIISRRIVLYCIFVLFKIRSWQNAAIYK